MPKPTKANTAAKARKSFTDFCFIFCFNSILLNIIIAYSFPKRKHQNKKRGNRVMVSPLFVKDNRKITRGLCSRAWLQKFGGVLVPDAFRLFRSRLLQQGPGAQTTNSAKNPLRK